ncbi:MAG: hypothetical protein AAGG51_15855 [Cyanobacteria bacterium P01_G01_bin.54]
MNPLFSHKFTIETDQPLDVVVERLQRYVKPMNIDGLIFRPIPAPEISQNLLVQTAQHHPDLYKGTVSETGFKIIRVVKQKNSFRPVIRGKFIVTSQGTTNVEIKMLLHKIVLVFLLFWYSVWYGIHLLGFGSFENGNSRIVMPLILLVVFRAAFWYESNRSKGDLEVICQEVSEAVDNCLKENRKKTEILENWLTFLGISSIIAFALIRFVANS